MAGFTSVAATAIQALGAVNTVLNAVDTYKGNSGQQTYNQTKALNDLQYKQALENAALKKEELRLNAEKTESERRAALRRAVAKQRAAYGADGISPNDGSAQAVLLGYFNESDLERQQREALDNLKKASIDQNVSDQARINTLQLTQIREKNRLKGLTSAYSLGNTLLGQVSD